MQGKLTSWNADRGFGFITPAAGAKQVWVHYTAFLDRTTPPEVGQLVTFSLSTDEQGRPCAEGVARAGDKPLKSRIGDRSSWSFIKAALFVLVLAAAGVLAYLRYHQEPDESVPLLVAPPSAPPRVAQPGFQCDGRTHCSHMNSCEEAYFFLEHCPNTKMDGDRDGVPCERQWC